MTKDEKNKYWKEKYYDFKSSNLSAYKWCKENNIATSTFFKWRKIFESSNSESGWVTVNMKNKPTKESNKPIKVVIGKAIVEYSDDTCISTFSNLVKVLMDYV